MALLQTILLKRVENCRYVNYCELKEAEGESSCKITFRVKSDGSHVTYQFRFQPIGTQFIDNDTVYVIATPRNEIFPEHSVFKQSAEVSYTFTGKCMYKFYSLIDMRRSLNHKQLTDIKQYIEILSNLLLAYYQHFVCPKSIKSGN